MTGKPSKKGWMVDMPLSKVAVGRRPGKPIAGVTEKRASAAVVKPMASPIRVMPARTAGASQSSDDRLLAEQARRSRTRDTDSTQSAETSERMRHRMVERIDHPIESDLQSHNWFPLISSQLD